MIEIIGLLILSWILIWVFERGNLNVLGFYTNRRNSIFALILFFVSAACCLSGYIMQIYFAKEEYTLNPLLNFNTVASGIWLTFKSVLFEELLCRGVLLYIMIKKLGAPWAIVISSLLFGLLHVMEPELLHNIPQALLIFIFPFLLGLIMAYAYSKTFSIYLPIAIHFGWNLVQNFIFPGKAGSESVLILSSQPVVTVSYFIFYFMFLFPKIAIIITDYFIVKSIWKSELKVVKTTQE